MNENTESCWFLFQGSPTFQLLNGCEYVFVWRTVEACPVLRAEGEAPAQAVSAATVGWGQRSK